MVRYSDHHSNTRVQKVHYSNKSYLDPACAYFRSLKVEVKKKQDTIYGLIAEKNMYQSEVILLEEKLSALADECHVVKRKFLDLTK